MAPHRCVCPGSFDPITAGHVDVIGRAASLFDEVVVAVLGNPAKQHLFALDERVSMIEEVLAGIEGVRVAPVPDGLLVDFCAEVGAVAVVKGIRSSIDAAYELPMALMNRHLTGVETVLLPGAPEFAHVSSSLVKEVAGLGGDVAGMVPDAVLPALTARLPARLGRRRDLQ